MSRTQCTALGFNYRFMSVALHSPQNQVFLWVFFLRLHLWKSFPFDSVTVRNVAFNMPEECVWLSAFAMCTVASFTWQFALHDTIRQTKLTYSSTGMKLITSISKDFSKMLFTHVDSISPSPRFHSHEYISWLLNLCAFLCLEKNTPASARETLFFLRNAFFGSLSSVKSCEFNVQIMRAVASIWMWYVDFEKIGSLYFSLLSVEYFGHLSSF